MRQKNIFQQYLFLVFSVICMQTPVKAQQDLSLDWLNAGGGTEFDINYGIQIDGEFNTVTIGEFGNSVDFDFGPGTQSLTSNGQSDIFIRKLDSDGNLIWVKSIGGVNYDRAASIHIDNNNDIYVLGTFINTVDFDPGTGVHNLTSSITNTYDVFLLKLTAQGEFAWVRQFEGLQLVQFGWGGNTNGGLKGDSQNNIYFTGSYTGEIDFDPGLGVFTLNNTGAANVFVEKLDVNGNFVWVKEIEHFTASAGTYLIGAQCDIDAEDNIILSGRFRDTIDVDPSASTNYVFSSSVGAFDLFVVKWNSNGVYQWVKSFNLNHWGSYYNSLEADYANNIVLTGNFSGTVDFDPGIGVHEVTSFNSGIHSSSYVLKLDENGSFVWVNTFNRSYANHKGLDIDQCGSVYYSSSYLDSIEFISNTDTISLSSDYSANVFVLKIDESGVYKWAEQIDGSSTSNNYTRDILVDNQSNVFLIGSFTGDSCDFAPGADEFHASAIGLSHDLFIVKYDQCESCVIDHIDQCDSLFWIDSLVYTESNNTAMYTLSNDQGCDSVVRLNLTMSESVDVYQVITSCTDYTWIDGVTYITDNNTATYVLPASGGCDSTIHLDLTLGIPFVVIDTQEACGSFTWVDGQTYLDDEYYATMLYTSQGGCDSMVRLNLDIIPMEMEIEETDTALNSLHVSSTATYQWLDCNNGYTVVNGETSSYLSQSLSGAFALEITQGYCIDTTLCYATNTFTTNEYNPLNDIVVYTDYASNMVTVTTSNIEYYQIVLYDMLGHLVQSTIPESSSDFTFALPEVSGVYILEIQTAKGRKQFKMIKP